MEARDINRKNIGGFTGILEGKDTKVAIIGHSLIHLRQTLFVDELRKQGIDVLEIYPHKWGNQAREGGYKIEGMSISDYTFGDDAYNVISNFSPDLLYTMSEWWSKQAYRSTRWTKKLGIPHALFCWENIHLPNWEQLKLLEKQALVVCGNLDAERIIMRRINSNTVFLPQVGIDVNLFRPHMDDIVTHDIIFVGRQVYEKGIDYINKLHNNGYNVVTISGFDYYLMPSLYNSARVQVVPSINIPQWREQWPACIGEGLACGLPCVVFNSGSIKDHYHSCDHVLFVNCGDYEKFEESVHELLGNLPSKDSCREWVENNLSNKIIASKLIDVFKFILKEQRENEA